jgi:hypothetical protein
MEKLEARLATLERTLRFQRIVLFGLASMIAVGASLPSVLAQQTPDTLRTRQLIIEDANGRARIRLGAPLPGTGTPRTGLRINDERGFERLGLNLFDDGRMVVGLDAPPSPAGTPFVNPERINLVAESDGGSYIVFKDRRSFVVGRLYLDAMNQAFLEFSDFSRTPPVRRRIGLAGEDSPR